MSGSDSEPTAASITCEVYGHEHAAIHTAASDIPVFVICERCGARWVAVDPRKEPAVSAPRIGTLVHYLSHGSADGTHDKTCRPALVTEVTARDAAGEIDEDHPVLHLVVFNPTGQFFNACAYDGDVEHGGTWHHQCVAGARFLPDEEDPS